MKKIDTIEKRLKVIRKKAGFSQKQLADVLGITARTLQRYEKDSSTLPAKAALKISLLCNVDLKWFLVGEDSESNTTDPSVSKIVDKFLEIKKYSPGSYDKIKLYINTVHETVSSIKKEKNDWQDKWDRIEHPEKYRHEHKQNADIVEIKKFGTTDKQ
ncbi:MAG: helix-turn-helix domain-containing protein [Desulfobacteraceae bacterium]|nr:helix-turn-helix domain-containing protein [Desulfobacteraceae bacterium]